MAAVHPNPFQLSARVLASVLGGYSFTWGFSALLQAVAAKLAVKDAYFLSELLNFVVLLLAFLWAYVPRRLAVVWCVLVLGGVAMASLAWLFTHS